MGKITRLGIVSTLVAATISGSGADAVLELGPAHHAVGWLTAQTDSAGLIVSPGVTEDAVMGAAASGVDPATLSSGGSTALDYLLNNQGTAMVDCASAGKLGLALVAARRSAQTEISYLVEHAVSNGSVVGPIAGNGPVFTGTDVRFCSSTWDQAFSMLAFAASRQPVPVGAVNHLLGLQQPNGGWEYSPGWGADSNSTALALQALAASGVRSGQAVANGLLYLRTTQAASGGFSYSDPSWGSDANSDAIVVQALVAVGQDPCSPAWGRGLSTPAGSVGTATAVTDLLSLQQPDGSFSGYSPAFATAAAPVALMGQSWPVIPIWAPNRAYNSTVAAHPADPCA